MTDWNPVEGLEEIEFEDIKVGDTIRTYCNHNGFESCVQHVVTDLERSLTRYKFYTPGVREVVHLISDGPKFCLVSRAPIEEPTGRGDLAEIYRPNPEGAETEEVEVYVRARHKFQDESFGGNEAWTDSANDLTKSWEEIVAWARNVPEFALRTYTATHKENK